MKKMKKLLAILGSLGLVLTTGSSVISCGNNPSSVDPVDPVDPADTVADLEKAFEEVNYNVCTSTTTKSRLVRSIDTSVPDASSYQIFNFQTLEGLTFDDSGVIDFKNDDDLQAKVLNDLNSLLDQSQYINEVKTLIAGNSEFKNLYNGNPESTIGSFKIDTKNESKIKKISDIDSETKTNFYSINFSFTKTFNYLDTSGAKASKEVSSKTINLLIGSEEGITKKIETITNEAGAKLLESKASVFTFDDLKEQDSTFKKYGQINNGLFNVINTKEKFKTILQEEVSSIFSNSGFDAIISGEDGKMIKNEDDVHQQRSFLDSAYCYFNDLTNANTNPILKNLMFNSDNSYQTQISKEDAIKGLKQIYQGYDSYAKDCDNALKTDIKYNDKNIPDELMNELTQKWYSYGTLELDNLQITISKDGQETKIPIPSIKTPWVYLTTNETDGQKEEQYFSDILTSLKEVDKYMFSINSDEKQKTTLLKADSSMQNALLDSAQEDYNDIDKLSTYLDSHDYLTGWGGFSEGAKTVFGGEGTDYNSILQDDDNYMFSSIKGSLNNQDLKIIKTEDGRIGYKQMNEKAYAEFTMYLGGVLEISFCLGNEGRITGYDGADIAANYPTNLLSSDWTSFSDYTKFSIADKNSLIWELGKVDAKK